MQQSHPRAGSCSLVQGGTSSGALPGFHHVHLILVAYLCDRVYVADFQENESCKEPCKKE